MISHEIFDTDNIQLITELQILREENKKLKAESELQKTTFCIFGLQIQYQRLPTASAKENLIDAISKAQSVLKLKQCLAVIGLSVQRYASWIKRQKNCALEDQKSCPKLSPHQLKSNEIEAMEKMVKSKNYFHIPISSLSVMAKREKIVAASPTTWGKLIKKFGWKRPKIREYQAKPKIGIRGEYLHQYWHLDLTVIKLIDGTRCFIQAIMENMSRYILAHSVSLEYGGGRTKELLLNALEKAKELGLSGIPNVIFDGGSENDNDDVKSLVSEELMKQSIAQIDIDYSNSLIESFFRSLKNNYLYYVALSSLEVLQEHTDFYVEQHNDIIPHSAHKTATPFEVIIGGILEENKKLIEQFTKDSRMNRLQFHNALSCATC